MWETLLSKCLDLCALNTFLNFNYLKLSTGSFEKYWQSVVTPLTRQCANRCSQSCTDRKTRQPASFLAFMWRNLKLLKHWEKFHKDSKLFFNLTALPTLQVENSRNERKHHSVHPESCTVDLFISSNRWVT